ncbi:MAG TPA: TolC family protein, partial [Spirochaetota bacterium]
DREYKKSTRNSELAMTVLNNTLGGNDPVNPTSPLFVLKEVKPLEYYQHLADDNNPLLKQIAANRDLAHQSLLKEVATYSPDIFIFGSRQLYEWHSPDYLPKWMVGFGATWNIFEGFEGTNKVRAARSQEERVASLESKAKKDIHTLVEKNYQELMLALEQYHSIQASYKFAEEYLRVREKAFVEGSATSLDVVDAQLAFAKVRIDKLKAAYDFDVALASLLEASGQSSQYDHYMDTREEVEF